MIPDLLRTLDLAGAIVTVDTAGCQVENARIIRGQGGHYLLAVKDNQPTLRAAVERVAAAAAAADFAGVPIGEEADAAHGRQEERYVSVFGTPAGIPADWPDVAAVVQVNREREVGGKQTCTTHYYLTSYAGTAAEMGAFVRGHWGIENHTQTTSEATTCASPGEPVTISPEAHLKLTAWCRQREGQGGRSCDSTHPPVCPPVPAAAGPTDGGLGPTPARPTPAPATPPRRAPRPPRDGRGGPAAGGAS